MRAVALEIHLHNPFGALRPYVEDGTCEDEDLETCLAQPELAPDERSFAERLLNDLNKWERAGAWALSSCEDIVAAADQLRRLGDE